MPISDFRHKYIVTLSDTAENTVYGKMCMDGFASHQFLLPDKPGYAIAQENCETEFSAGDVIYAAAGKFFGIRCDGQMRVRCIAFNGKRLRPLLHYCGLGEFTVVRFPRNSGISSRFDKIFEFNGAPPEMGAKISAELYSLIGFISSVRIEADNYVYDKRSLIVKPVMDYMNRNYRRLSPPFPRLLASLGMSREELDALFSDIFSMTAAEYYKRLRMENAKHLLFFYYNEGTEYTARILGYKNAADFRADFYGEFKITPDEFTALYH